MAICILTPISEQKAYSLHHYIKGVCNLSYPKEDIFWLFIVQQQGLEKLSDRLSNIQAAVEPKYFGVELIHYPVPVSDQFFNPRYSPHLSWKERALIAALMRQVGIDFVKEALPEITHILSLGCDVILNDPESLSHLLEGPSGLTSGIIYARQQNQPLVLTYEMETRAWNWWWDYPRDHTFKTDWTGMDILLISREVFEGITLDDFTIDEYGIGEDGWYCIKAREELGVETWVDPRVTPYHVHKGNTIRYAYDLPAVEAFKSICPFCGGFNGVQKKVLIDVLRICPQCMKEYYEDPWEFEPEAVSGDQAPTGVVAYG